MLPDRADSFWPIRHVHTTISPGPLRTTALSKRHAIQLFFMYILYDTRIGHVYVQQNNLKLRLTNSTWLYTTSFYFAGRVILPLFLLYQAQNYQTGSTFATIQQQHPAPPLAYTYPGIWHGLQERSRHNRRSRRKTGDTDSSASELVELPCTSYDELEILFEHVRHHLFLINECKNPNYSREAQRGRRSCQGSPRQIRQSQNAL